jgi:large conductance mechanosensitive channel
MSARIILQIESIFFGGVFMAATKSSFIGDFRGFILKGNVIDLAVAVILGTAFGKIVESLIKDVITPAILVPLFAATGAKNLETVQVGDIKLGLFFSALINFLVIGIVMFLMVRAYEKAKKKMSRQEAMAEEAGDPALAAQQELVSAINRLNTTVAQKM